MTAYNWLSLRNGKLIELREGNMVTRINYNETPADYSNDRIEYFPSGTSFTSD